MTKNPDPELVALALAEKKLMAKRAALIAAGKLKPDDVAVSFGNKAKPPEPDESGLIKLHLACGTDKREGFLNVDIVETKTTDLVLDLRKFPWPWEDESVAAIECKDFLQIIPGDGRLAFLDECWRVLAMGKQLSIWAPAEAAGRAYMDPLWPWPPISETFFYFADRPWRETNGHADRAKCNFHWAPSFLPDGEIASRNEEFMREAIKFKRNSFHTLQVVMTKLP